MAKGTDKRKASLFDDDEDEMPLSLGKDGSGKKAKKSLLNDEDGSAEDGLELKVNQAYAKRFEVSASSLLPTTNHACAW